MCGCLGSNTKSKSRPRQVSDSSFKTLSEPVCLDLKEELQEVERKTLFLLTKDTADSVLTESNRQIRIWMRNLTIECPDDYNYNVIKQYVENEYTKYNS